MNSDTSMRGECRGTRAMVNEIRARSGVCAALLLLAGASAMCGLSGIAKAHVLAQAASAQETKGQDTKGQETKGQKSNTETAPAVTSSNMPANTPANTPTSSPTSSPSLDDLLGITDVAPARGKTTQAPGETSDGSVPVRQSGPAGSAGTAGRSELDRRLSPGQPEQDPFKIAVELMNESATRLNTTADSGLDTQRLQQEVILRLDQLISQAQKKPSKQKPKPQQNQQQQQQQSQQNQQQDASSQRAKEQAASGQGAQDTQSGPAGQAPNPRTPPAGAGAAWGNLPAHMRAALLQGSSDRFSSIYQGMTEEYYKRLAEEPSARRGTSGTGSSGGSDSATPKRTQGGTP